nr:SLAM family member 6-like [Misgurnus anguillicaudatus]
MEGDSVTLYTDITQIQRDDHILWLFGPQGTRIAQIDKKSIDVYNSFNIFGDKLNLDSQTGSLTITNIRITHTGLYKLQIISKSGIKYKAFSVTVYASLFVPVIVKKSSSGRSSVSKCVLLCSVSNVRDVSLSWYKGNRLLSIISESDLNISLSLPLEVEYQDTNTYRCVVSNPITNQTQHLNINHLCQTSSGAFGVDEDEVKLLLTEGESVPLHTNITDIQTDDHILWMFGPYGPCTAQIYNASIVMHECNKLFGDRLKVDSQTGSLTITNSTIKDSGLYQLEIRDRETKIIRSFKRFNVIVYGE